MTITDFEAAELLAELENAPTLDALRVIRPRQTAAQELGVDHAGLRHLRRVRRRIFRDDREARQSATALLCPLPKAGETLHLILPGTFTPLDLVPALLGIIHQKATSLRLATLGYSSANVDELCRMLDSKQVGSLSLICSRYFAATSKSIFAHAQQELPRRGARLLATRSHAKVMLVEDAKSRWTFEGSGNLRSCVCLEQVALTNDPELFRFHAAWFDHVLGQETPTL
jgi:hypothetical protein